MMKNVAVDLKDSTTIIPGAARIVLQRAQGIGSVASKQFSDRTRLASLFQQGSAKIRLPHTHNAALEAVLINTAGGLTGGDDMRWSADVAAGGHLILTTQACERVYRSIDGPAQVRTALNVGANAHLDWLPQETILFAASQLDRRIEIDLAPGASVTALEAVLLGRDAMGEEARDARLRDNWRVRRAGRLLHAEATQLGGTARERDSLSLLAGQRAFASILHVAPSADAIQTKLASVREIIGHNRTVAASANGERLVVRALAPTGLALRRLIIPVLLALSGSGTLPRLWSL